jgi:hypothetical protein
MTFSKFLATILPDVLSMKILAPHHGNYFAILTAVHDDAPPIIQWDTSEKRNPFSQYVYNNGSFASRWGVTTGWVDVSAICRSPSNWKGCIDHRSQGVCFVVAGAKDSGYKSSSNALFPEILKSEFHAVRSVIEAYSSKAEIFGYEEASACGLVGNGDNWNIQLLVKTSLGTSAYTIDRLD